ncbi:MAG: hypothetical protein ACXAB4_04340 [Candidatus Hodarchaeales archaeon]
MNNALTGSVWDRHCWLAGTILQKKLLRLERKDIPSPEKLREDNPDLSIAESIELARKSTSARLVERRVFVSFGSKWFDVTNELEEIILASRKEGRWIENIGVDTRALDVPRLTRQASELAIAIADGKFNSTADLIFEIEEQNSHKAG